MMIKIYKVGGCNRDDILGIRSNDIDYSVEADSYESMKLYVAATHTIVYEQPQYYTIKAKGADNNSVDFVLCRKDGAYRDGRRPESVERGTILDDLIRRDFTMNSIAIDIEGGAVIDPYNGAEDIEKRIIRCVGNTHTRITEDVLRLVRAFRFHIVLGFDIDSAIINYLWDINYVEKLEFVSRERIMAEMAKCFAFATAKTLKALTKFPVFSEYLFANIMRLKPVLLPL